MQSADQWVLRKGPMALYMSATRAREKFGAAELAVMEKRKLSAHIRTPDEVADNLEKGIATGGEKIYKTYCIACHLGDGKGDGSRFPPLDSSEYVLGDKSRLINILLNGMQEQIIVRGKQYNNLMPSHSFLSDEDLALVLAYARQNFGNSAGEITAQEVTDQRSKALSKKR